LFLYDCLGISSGRAWDDNRVKLGVMGYSGEILITAANAELAWASFKLVPQNGDIKLVITGRNPSWE